MFMGQYAPPIQIEPSFSSALNTRRVDALGGLSDTLRDLCRPFGVTGAVRELLYSLSHPYIWLAFAFEDLRDRYKRTLVGVLWVPLSFLAFVGIKVLIFAKLNQSEADNFFMYLIVGFWVWTTLTALVVDSSLVFARASGFMQTTALPYTTYVLQGVARNFLPFLLNFVMVIAGAAFLGQSGRFVDWLWVVPATAVYLFSAIWVSLLLGTLSARFRDLAHLVQTVMRMMFFLTPILWLPSQLGEIGETVALWNPLTHYIEIVRAPLIGEGVPGLSWAVVLAVSIVGALAGVLTYARFRNRLVFYV